MAEAYSTETRRTPAFVVHPDLGTRRDQRRSPELALEEAVALARALPAIEVVGSTVAKLRNPSPGMLFSSGKLEELAEAIHGAEAELVLIDGPVTPVQQRNLEKHWDVKILDRTGLILEIFADRARTREGVLQVELAALSYQRTRLVRAWTHLERQRGGFGFVGGPGETQIEADRRAIDDQMVRLRRQLERVVRTRTLHRAARAKVPYPIVALVGYTNAGKSTLFNRLTGAEVLAKDMLFATLDPTMRAIHLPSADGEARGRRIILSDTVGFISDLPTELVAAFRATLEEVLEADVILHVRDISHEDAEAQQSDVDAVLRQLGINPDDSGRIIEVWNKIDRYDPEQREELLNIAARRPEDHPAMLVSAVSGEGIDALLAAIEERLAAKRTTLDLSIDAADGAGISWLHRNSEVLAKELHDGRFDMTVRVDETKRDIVISRFDAVPQAG